MIYARPGEVYEAVLEGAPAGLAGLVGVRVIDTPAGTVVTPRTTAPVESAPGIYAVELTAPGAEGTYAVLWDLGDPTVPESTFAEQLRVGPTPGMVPSGGTPTAQDVAVLLRARTRDQYGVELGVFTTATRPTADAVAALIDQEARIVALRAGDVSTLECPDADLIRGAASSILAKRVAAIVEASYRPDEQGTGDASGMAAFYAGDADEDLTALADAAATCRAWTADPTDSDSLGPRPQWSFPRSRLGEW